MSESTDTSDDVAKADAELEKAVSAVLPLVQDGTISWSDLASKLAPKMEPVRAPDRTPLPKKVGDKLKLQIKKLPAVFGTVAPDVVRKLEPQEVVSLLDERDVLDDITKELADRKDDIRTIVLNHFDADMRERFCCDEDNDGLVCLQPKGHADDSTEHSFEFAPRSSDGHFAPRAEGEAWYEKGDGTSATGEQFAWERRANTKAAISPAMLKELADDPECNFFSHEDYLSFTRPERVFDENKAMLAIRKNPKLIMAIAKATRAGNVSAALNLRKVK